MTLAPRLALAASLAAFLAGCGSEPQTQSKDQPHAGNFTEVRTVYWTDQIGFGAGFVASRRCSDGALLTREHILACDVADTEAPAFWADAALETLPDGKTSRLLVLGGLGHEPAASPKRLALQRSDSGRWSRVAPDGNTEDLPAFDGCDDVEIEQDHVTADVVVHRLGLQAGETRDVERLLVRLPGMDVERVRRRLTRLDETSYSWEGLAADGSSAWRLDLSVDASGSLVAIAGPGYQHRAVREKTIR